MLEEGDLSAPPCYTPPIDCEEEPWRPECQDCEPEADYKWNDQDTVDIDYYNFDDFGMLSPTTHTLVWDASICGYSNDSGTIILAIDMGAWTVDFDGVTYGDDGNGQFTNPPGNTQLPYFEITNT